MDAKEPKEPNGKITDVEISVDACAELGGQAYEVIRALKGVYDLSRLRKLTYVDTFQGLREKSDCATPQMMFAMSEPHSRYGHFVHENKDWHNITETHECREFSGKLGSEILPQMTAPVIAAVEEISSEIRGEVYATLRASGHSSLSKVRVTRPEDIEIATPYRRPKRGTEIVHRRIANALIDKAVDRKMERWQEIVDANPILKLSDANKSKQMLIDLIGATQESKAIAAALLYHKNPEEAKQMGELPSILTRTPKMPPLAALRGSAHEFGNLHFKDEMWSEPEVQQAIRYTELWPWTRKSYMTEAQWGMLGKAHKNTADRAAVSYFLNHLAQQPDKKDTLYILVTHDGPLIDDFIKFSTGIGKREKVGTKIETPQGTIKTHEMVSRALPEREYKGRGLAHIEPKELPHYAILTGREFLGFVRHERKLAFEKTPMTHEFKQAMTTLDDAITLLEDAIKNDKLAYGVTKGGSFAQRQRKHIAGYRPPQQDISLG